MNKEKQIPKVSVIIAVYNNREYLKDAIDSALSQNYENADIWIVDDASPEKIMPELPVQTDPDILGSTLFAERREEIESYEYRYATQKPLYYIRLKKNGGPARARNIAIANAIKNGSHLFQILDSDDQMFPNKISRLIQPILLDPEHVFFAYADYYIQNESGITRYEAKPPYDYHQFFGGFCMIHSGSLVNGLAIKDFYPHFYPEHLRVTEDFYMGRRALRNRGVAVHVAEPLTLVRSHSMDSTNSVKKDIWNECFSRTMRET